MIHPAKDPVCAVTLVTQPDPFLDRWLDYYIGLMPADAVYVVDMSGGTIDINTERGVNHIRLPDISNAQQCARRQWHLYSQFVTGLAQFYNAVITTNSDELLIADPRNGNGLVSHIIKTLDVDDAPLVIAPLGMSLVQNRELEPFGLGQRGPVLDRRSLYCLNAALSKPCVVATAPMRFGPGGTSSNIKTVPQDPELFLIGLKFADIAQPDTHPDPEVRKFHELSEQMPTTTTVDHEDFRKHLLRRVKEGPFFKYGQAVDTNVYRLPDRFRSLF